MASGREQRSRRAVSAAADLARSEGLRVHEPAVLADLFSLMVHVRPAPVVAGVATTMPKLRSPIEDAAGDRRHELPCGGGCARGRAEP